MGFRRLSFFLLLVAAALSATPASADVRSGTSDGGGTLSVSYNQEAGDIAIAVSGASFSGQIKTYCSEYRRPVTSAGEETPIELSVSGAGAAATGGEAVNAASPVRVENGRLVASVQAAALTSLDLRCVEGVIDGKPTLLYFDGLRHETLTPASAEGAVRKDLLASFGTEPVQYVACPKRRVTDSALCRYKIGSRSGTVRVGTYTVEEGEMALTTSRARNQAYRQKAARCGARYQRDEVLGGTRVVVGKRLVAPQIFCSSDLVRMILQRAQRAYPSAVKAFTIKQTPAAGFEPLSSFRCTPRGRRSGGVVSYRFTCANKLGDKVSYRFKVARKTGKRPV